MTKRELPGPSKHAHSRFRHWPTTRLIESLAARKQQLQQLKKALVLEFGESATQALLKLKQLACRYRRERLSLVLSLRIWSTITVKTL
jgi:hypothetical protein